MKKIIGLVFGVVGVGLFLLYWYVLLPSLNPDSAQTILLTYGLPVGFVFLGSVLAGAIGTNGIIAGLMISGVLASFILIFYAIQDRIIASRNGWSDGLGLIIAFFSAWIIIIFGLIGGSIGGFIGRKIRTSCSLSENNK